MPRPALPGVNSRGRCPGRQLGLGVWPILTLGVCVFLILSSSVLLVRLGLGLGLGLGLLDSKACGQSLERPHGGNTSLGAGVLLFWCCRASFELLPVPVPVSCCGINLGTMAWL